MNDFGITTMKHDPKRATGRTLGLILQALGKAVENPGTEVEFIDHSTQNHALLQSFQMCKERIESIAKQLNLDVSVKVNTNNTEYFGLFVKSNWVSPYAQRTSAEEKWKEIYGSYPANWYDVEKFECFKKGYEAAK
jgi:hypothetical protein